MTIDRRKVCRQMLLADRADGKRREAKPSMIPRAYLSFFSVQHHAPEIVIHRMAFVEAQRILRNHVQLPAESGESFTVN